MALLFTRSFVRPTIKKIQIRPPNAKNIFTHSKYLPKVKKEQRAKLQRWMLNRNKFTREESAISQEACTKWLPFFSDAKLDPFVELPVYKRSSYLTVKPDGGVEALPPAPITQSSDYNRTSQADKKRNYDDVQMELVNEPSFQEYVQQFAKVHELGPNEPILTVNIQTRIEPFSTIQNADPLTGQGIHRDGMAAVSVLCVSRENCSGAESVLYADRAGKRHLTTLTLDPGQAVHFRDLEMFHDVTPIQAVDPSKPMHRSVLVLLARFQEEGWHNNMVDHYGSKGYTCIKGTGEFEQLFDLLDFEDVGEVSFDDLVENMFDIDTGMQEMFFTYFDAENNKVIKKKDFISLLENEPIQSDTYAQNYA